MIQPRSFHVSEPVRHESFTGHRITVSEMMALDGAREIDPDFMQRALKAPLHYKTRQDYQNQLAHLF
ncbi:MAG: hypothetical protein MO846_04500 [Candidatus Devosia symbiotica]|nr:hypothetical protein [Candidatus Devosia symbiotica]